MSSEKTLFDIMLETEREIQEYTGPGYQTQSRENPTGLYSKNLRTAT